jgi:hypothetical protein
MRRPLLFVGVACLACTCAAQTVELQTPRTIVAGSAASISTTGSGDATFYLLGPDHVVKQHVRLGDDISLGPDQVRTAGRYLATLCSEACRSADFYVTPASPAGLSFLVHPSRVPVQENDAISGVVFPFDRFHNLVLAPVTVRFTLTSGKAVETTRAVPSRGGVAWLRISSGTRAGSAQLTASLGDLSARRVVQQVASDPCNLRIAAQQTAESILVQTQPVRDCSGNPVPDGTIVTFRATDAEGESTIDVPIKHDVASTKLEASGPTVISAASGVVMGNEIRVGGRQ